MAKDFYQILEVSKNASDEEIKKAYRKLAHEHHPDKEGGNEEKFKKINEAYQVLSDSEKKKQYDQYGQTFEQAQRKGGYSGYENYQGYSDFSDIFRNQQNQQRGQSFEFDLGDIFEDFLGFGGTKKRTQSRKKQGEDINLTLYLDFKEAVFGIEKEIELYKNTVCYLCHGKGAEPGSKIVTCSHCHGAGQVEQIQSTLFGKFRTVVSCPTCQGQGRKNETLCSKCRGAGRTKQSQKLKVKIPAGIDHGQTIRVAEQGEAGLHEGKSGDLLIQINVKSHPHFVRDSFNIKTTISIPYSLACLGGKTEIETLEKKVFLKIPAGTESGKIFRLFGQGIPHLNQRGRGDQLIEVIVKTPKHLTREQKNLLENLEKQGL